jgi:hypothetical protein
VGTGYCALVTKKISRAALEMTRQMTCHLEPFGKAQGRLREQDLWQGETNAIAKN